MRIGRPFGYKARRRRIAPLLLFSLAMQAARPGAAQELPQAADTPVVPAAMAATAAEIDGDARRGFRLPPSHRNSVYFLPGSAELTETAIASLSDTAGRLQTDTALHVTVVGYADDLGEATSGEELRADRATAVVRALVALGVPLRRIATAAPDGEEDATRPCISEYCRQSYRRAALLFSKFATR